MQFVRNQAVKDRAAAAAARLARIREGLEPIETDDAMGLLRWRAPLERGKRHQGDRDLVIPFHLPATRRYRLSNADGATSFHFSHRYINKVTFEMREEGLRNRPGAARAHARYVEREAAIAELPPLSTVEAGAPKGLLAEDELGVSDAYLRPETLNGDTSPATARAPEAADHDYYIARPDAVAIQPDGSRALLTNIDPDEDERARFWSLVEEHEAKASPDQMSLRIADQPEFWGAVQNDGDCPAELKRILEKSDPYTVQRFDIRSGKEIRRFLRRQPGWREPSRSRGRRSQPKGETPFAKFHDGRRGRTQYRIVGELPDELDIEQRFAILRSFTETFSKRNLPFVAVMHAPDHHNDEKNWHFHLIYYDRPCRRITEADIGDLTRHGFKTDHLEPGVWDFTVVTPKRHRSNGKATPLKQKKVSEVTADGWIKMLRRDLAAITNAHLARARKERRVDARRYSEMGILADPQEHLGSGQAAAETRGEPTAAGIENERRQWAAIMAEADMRRETALATAEVQAAGFLHGFAAPGDGQLGESRPADRVSILRQSLREAVMLDDIAFRLEQDLDRSRSRAMHVQRTNQQLLRAYEAYSTAGSQRDRIEASRLAEAASAYLASFDRSLAGEIALVDECRRLASAERDRAHAIEFNRDRPVPSPERAVAALTVSRPEQGPAVGSITGAAAPAPAISGAAPQANTAAPNSRSARETGELMATGGAEKLGPVAHEVAARNGEPVASSDRREAEQNEAARRAAIAAAMRNSLGR